MKKILINLFLLVSIAASADETIKGRVVDEQQEPMVGVNIVVQGTATGTISDIDGEFSISVPSAKSVLEFSYMGYTTKQLNAGNGRQMLIVQLQEDKQLLDEVVVVGYGVQRKSDLTGAVSSVKMDETINNTPTADITEALQGRLSGVSIVQSSGQPGSEATIRIRGTNSILGDGGPLVVIDGIIGGSLSQLNPADIASVEVLKDASATAIYGSRANNGVILVTTKRPQAGRINVTYNGYVNMKTPYTLPKVLNGYDYALLANEYGQEFYASAGSDAHTFYSPEQLQMLQNGEMGYDYLGHVFREMGIEHNHELSVSGGSEKVRFLFSASYNDNQGIVYNSRAQRVNYRLKVDADIRKWLSIGANFYGNWSTSYGPRFSQYNNMLIQTLTYPTAHNVFDENGDYNNKNDLGPQYNPMIYINETNSKGYTLNNFLQAYAQFNIYDGLSFRTIQSFKFGNTEGRYTYGKGSYEYYQTYGSRTGASVRISDNYQWTNQNILTYAHDFTDNHRLNLTGVFEQYRATTFFEQTSGVGLTSTQLGANALQFAQEPGTPQTGSTEHTMMSVLLRANYTLFRRYMFTVAWRYDGSSILAKENRWQSFPSAAVAWDLKQEPWMDNVNNVEQLKIRFGFGITGNQAVPNYSSFTQINASRNAENELAYNTARIGTPDLCWEKNTQYNVGLDLSFFGSRLTANLEGYIKKSEDMLLSIDANLYTGFAERQANAASMTNRGVELTLTGVPVKMKNFLWTSTFICSHNKGVIDNLSQGREYTTMTGGYEKDIYRLIKGQPIGTMWGFKNLGVWTTDEINELKASMTAEEFGKLSIEPGAYKIEDIDGQPGITTEDKQIIGNGQPLFSWSWNNTFSFYGVDLSLYFIGNHGFDIYNYTEESRLSALSPTPALANRWRAEENENTNIAGFVALRNGVTPMSRFVEKGDFVKLKSITVGYSLPKQLLQKATIEQVRFYVSIQNPILITSYSGIDPEVTLRSPLTPGIDWGYYPNGRNYKIGLNFTF